MNPQRSNRMLQLAVRFVSTMGLVATGLPSFLAAGSFLAVGRGKPRTSTQKAAALKRSMPATKRLCTKYTRTETMQTLSKETPMSPKQSRRRMRLGRDGAENRDGIGPTSTQ